MLPRPSSQLTSETSTCLSNVAIKQCFPRTCHDIWWTSAKIPSTKAFPVFPYMELSSVCNFIKESNMSITTLLTPSTGLSRLPITISKDDLVTGESCSNSRILVYWTFDWSSGVSGLGTLCSGVSFQILSILLALLNQSARILKAWYSWPLWHRSMRLWNNWRNREVSSIWATCPRSISVEPQDKMPLISERRPRRQCLSEDPLVTRSATSISIVPIDNELMSHSENRKITIIKWRITCDMPGITSCIKLG